MTFTERLIYYSTAFLVELAAFVMVEPVLMMIGLCVLFFAVGFFVRLLVIR